MRIFITGIVIGILSMAVGIAGLCLTATIFDANNWPYLHSWGLMHGSGVLCFLIWTLVATVFFRIIAKRLNLLPADEIFTSLPYLAFVTAAMGTFIFTDYFMWVGAILGIIALIRWRQNRLLAAPGVGISALLVSAVSLAYWSYLQYVFHAALSTSR